ncbi:MAG: S-layer homology domain-containing protein, partial [Clostridia bacterium]|nr:S-layer homology domain-containing protein [Clostridia bacterium]
MLKSKKILSIMLVVMMLVQTLFIPSFAAEPEQFTDFPVNMWSTEAMTAAVANGLITGTSETTIEPTKNLTRAEFATIVTRAFGATKTADISKFEDVKQGDWYYDSVAKIVQMGVMKGTGDTTFAPDSPMKREDVILALARILFVDGDDTSVLDKFSDKDKIDEWSTKAIAGMVSEGYVNGYEDGTIRPQNNITREELAQLFHNMFKTYISAEGEYNSVAAEGSVIVRSKGVTLRDVTINGDLVLADGIGDGDFRLTNVTVKGKIIVRGGEGTVYFTNVKADGKVIINDPNGTVNFYNYRDEAPFRDNLIENTPATFLERPVHGGGSVTGGSSKKYDFYVYKSYEDIVDGKDPYISVENKSYSYKIKASEVPTEIDGRAITGWYKENDIELYSRNDIVGKQIKKVAGNWYPVYAPQIFTVYFYDLTVSEDDPVFTYEVPEGGTVADFVDPENDAKTTDEIKAELSEHLEFSTIPGYGKDYDDAYLFNEFEDMGTGYYETFGTYAHEHEINYSWYAEDDAEEY